MRLYLTMLNAYCGFLKLKFHRGNVRAHLCECISNSNFMSYFTFSGMSFAQTEEEILFIK